MTKTKTILIVWWSESVDYLSIKSLNINEITIITLELLSSKPLIKFTVVFLYMKTAAKDSYDSVFNRLVL